MTSPTRQDEFLALLDEHRRILYKVAGSYCRNPADRQDLTQEIVVQLWRSFNRYDDRFRFSTWMYRIALNVAISHLRTESRRARHSATAGDEILEIPAEVPESAAREADLQALWEVIHRLDELDRALVILYLDGNRYDAIAEILGISETNVGTKLTRIKKRLQRDLAKTA